MGWEARGNHRYYTRSKRVNGRVVREYIGGGIAGEIAAREDDARRRRKAEADERLRRVQAAIEAAAAPHRTLDRLADALMRAVLVDAGYHRHDRGTWRKRRDHTERE